MRGIIVHEIPERTNHNLKRFLEEFMHTNVKHFKVEYTDGEYRNSNVAYESLRVAAKRHKCPIKVTTRNGEVYLTRTDM